MKSWPSVWSPRIPSFVRPALSRSSKSFSRTKITPVLGALTRVAPSKPVPVIVTVSPTIPSIGVNEVIPPETTTKFVALTSVPPGVTIEIGPVTAPAGTTAVTFVGDTAANVAAVATDDPVFVAEAIAVGAKGYVTKPYTDEQVLTQVRAL